MGSFEHLVALLMLFLDSYMSPNGRVIGELQLWNVNVVLHCNEKPRHCFNTNPD